MLFFLGMVYVIGGTICSTIVVAACILHSRTSRMAPQVPTTYMRRRPVVAERKPAVQHNAPDADDALVVHPV